MVFVVPLHVPPPNQSGVSVKMKRILKTVSVCSMNSDSKGMISRVLFAKQITTTNQKQIKMVDLELEKLFQDDPWLRPYQGQLQER